MARNEAKSGAATLHCAGAWRAMTSRKGTASDCSISISESRLLLPLRSCVLAAAKLQVQSMMFAAC